MITLDGHPRARGGIRRARAGGGLALAVLTGVLAHRSGVAGQELVLRALLAGVIGHLVAWAGAIAWFRVVARAEIVRALEQRHARVDAVRARQEREISRQG